MKKLHIFVIGALALALVACIGYAANEHLKLKDLTAEYQELALQKDCDTHQATIDALVKEKAELAEKLEAKTNNFEEKVCSDAETFLKTLYTTDNTNAGQQYEELRNLVTESVYEELAPHTEPGAEVDAFNSTYAFETGVRDIQSYYSPVDNTTANVFMVATQWVKSDAGSTETMLIFQCQMQYRDEIWVVSDILQHTTVRENY